MYLWCYHITPELLLNKLMVLANTLISIVSRVLSNNTYIDEIHTGKHNMQAEDHTDMQDAVLTVRQRILFVVPYFACPRSRGGHSAGHLTGTRCHH